VAVQDAAGRTVRAGRFDVTLALEGPGGGRLGGALTAPTVNGIATFSDLTLDQPGRYTLAATAPGLSGVSSASFQAGPGAGIMCERWLDLKDVSDVGLTMPQSAPAGRRCLPRWKRPCGR